MTASRFRFDRFVLDRADRRLVEGDRAVEVNARYLDALILLVAEPGRLVSKDRFMTEVWRGVPVTDEALTQCIRALRRALGDDAARPRFIETVPKHGYRFVAAVTTDDAPVARIAASSALPRRDYVPIGLAGMTGAGIAGAIGGLLYGFAVSAQPLQPGVAAVSVLIVLLVATVAIALVGGAGVGFGVAVAGPPSWRSIVGGAIGGMVTGAIVKLVGGDAFMLLLGRSPGDITGAGEGALLGAAAGLGAWLAASRGVRVAGAIAALCGAAAGAAATATGGRLMAGSLDALVRNFPDARLSLDPLGRLLGDAGFGATAQMVSAVLEGALFTGGVVAAMQLARRRA